MSSRPPRLDALIGYTGFVGSNLLGTESYSQLFNSKNINDIRGKHFARVVCAGVTAVKWWANRNPTEDWTRIQTLMDCLRLVSADSFTLISTIDVYDRPNGVTEDDRPIPKTSEVYGKHRLVLEDFVAERFKSHHVVRLPGLFGPGLKKNVIFDLMHDNGLPLINPESKFQWYPVSRLGADLRIFERAGYAVVNVATEPVATREIHELFFKTKQIHAAASPSASYDMRTKYEALLGGGGGYFLKRAAVIEAIGRFLAVGG